MEWIPQCLLVLWSPRCDDFHYRMGTLQISQSPTRIPRLEWRVHKEIRWHHIRISTRHKMHRRFTLVGWWRRYILLAHAVVHKSMRRKRNCFQPRQVSIRRGHHRVRRFRHYRHGIQTANKTPSFHPELSVAVKHQRCAILVWFGEPNLLRIRPSTNHGPIPRATRKTETVLLGWHAWDHLPSLEERDHIVHRTWRYHLRSQQTNLPRHRLEQDRHRFHTLSKTLQLSRYLGSVLWCRSLEGYVCRFEVYQGRGKSVRANRGRGPCLVIRTTKLSYVCSGLPKPNRSRWSQTVVADIQQQRSRQNHESENPKNTRTDLDVSIYSRIDSWEKELWTGRRLENSNTTTLEPNRNLECQRHWTSSGGRSETHNSLKKYPPR